MAGTNGIVRRLDALEEIAERCRRRECDALIAEEIRRRSGPPTVAHLAKVSALADRMEAWQRAGLSLPEMARREAGERGLDPERVVAILEELRVQRRIG
jgi:hypothetical protein